MAALSWGLKCLGICGAVALAVWITKSAWPLLGLCFLTTWDSCDCDKKASDA